MSEMPVVETAPVVEVVPVVEVAPVVEPAPVVEVAPVLEVAPVVPPALVSSALVGLTNHDDGSQTYHYVDTYDDGSTVERDVQVAAPPPPPEPLGVRATKANDTQLGAIVAELAARMGADY